MSFSCDDASDEGAKAIVRAAAELGTRWPSGLGASCSRKVLKEEMAASSAELIVSAASRNEERPMEYLRALCVAVDEQLRTDSALADAPSTRPEPCLRFDCSCSCTGKCLAPWLALLAAAA